MLEEALPLAVGVGVALLPCLAFGGLSAFRAFAILGGEDSGFFKALEEGKTEEEALAATQGAQPTIHTPYEPIARVAPAAQTPVVAHSVVERRAAAPSYGFAARYLQ
ncbi:hypothetical protein MNEG_9275 [Monoraphidium neglectum]|uniref:Uncharacterized protein n=1 Tax=Monoraphidium neglectum TaxID=145388 RepID=A0A0D2JH57_9CHLO|nr:hypothetical protein MNEG_9275 [Monoraphidium neglectum]KIY98687.1 hypothetical protein MNEG_9275 [Monoraphidium neglectum]|eukprot:XP_013897707.1 hypothetical protein MNEG_9275 [Monoraphidium neglectum]